MLLTDILQDALQLAQAEDGDVNLRSVSRTVLKNDSFKIMTLTRMRAFARRWHVPLANHVLRVAQTAVMGVEIGSDVTLDHGVYFVHPYGTVVGGDAKVGKRVRFYGNNTVGTAKENGCPTIEDDVQVGAGARILGPVHVGAGAVIGANAVVLEDVPAGAVVAGIPAKIIKEPK